MKSGFLEKLIQRIDRLNSNEVQRLVMGLVKEKGFLENVFEALQEGVMILTPDGSVSFVNRAACEFFGIEAERLVGNPLKQILRGFEWDQLANPRTAVSRDLEVFYPEHRFLNFYLAPIHREEESGDEQEEDYLPGFVMLIRDETQSRQQSEEQRESEQLNVLTLLAAGVAHEIGNPLNSLGIHLQLMKRRMRKMEGGAPSELLNHLETAENEIERLDTILKQFLNAIRPTKPDRKACQFNDLIQDTLAVLEPTLADRSVTVELALESNLPSYQADADQFKQVFFNLIKNGYEALSGEDGTLILGTRSTETEILIDIVDNGSGISPEVMGSLFEPYSSQKQSGTGLGLLIVRRIVREHGGEIEVRSELGEGTRITLHFPRLERKVRLLALDPETSEDIIDLERNS